MKNEVFAVAVLIFGTFGSQLTLGQAAATPSTLPDSPSFIKQAAFQPPVLTSSSPLPEPQQTTPSSQQSSSNTVGGLLKRGLQDQKEIYTLPLHRRNLKWTALFLAGTGGLIAADRHISGEISRDHTGVSQTISDVGLYSMIGSVGVIGLAGWRNGDSHQEETAFLGAESFANSAIVLIGTQLIAGRQRPLEGNGHGDFWTNNSIDSSFPSGHSIFTWTLAGVVAHEYPSPWVQFLTYGTATTVSITRVTGLRHFPADAAVGAVFGYFIAQHIFHAHCRPGLSPSCHGDKQR